MTKQTRKKETKKAANEPHVMSLPEENRVSLTEHILAGRSRVNDASVHQDEKTSVPIARSILVKVKERSNPGYLSVEQPEIVQRVQEDLQSSLYPETRFLLMRSKVFHVCLAELAQSPPGGWLELLVARPSRG